MHKNSLFLLKNRKKLPKPPCLRRLGALPPDSQRVGNGPQIPIVTLCQPQPTIENSWLRHYVELQYIVCIPSKRKFCFTCSSVLLT